MLGAASPRSFARQALGRPGVARLLTLSLVGTMPASAVALLLILRIRDIGGTYALAGMVAASFALGHTIGAPIIGRLADRHGQPLVLTCCGAVAFVALVSLAMTPERAPAAMVIVLASLAGLAQPPIAACARVRLRGLLPETDLRHAAMSVQASFQELAVIAGPLLLVSAIGAASPAAGLLGAAAILGPTTLLFVWPRSMRDAAATGRAVGHRVGSALRQPSVRTLALLTVTLGITFGTLEVGLAAVAEDFGRPALLGGMLAVYGVGSLAAGVASALRPAPRRAERRLVVLLAVAAGAHATLSLAASRPWLLFVGLVLAGSAIAPTFAVVYGLVALLAEEATLTEAFTWLGCGLGAGVSMGALTAGATIGAVAVGPVFLLAGAALAAGALGARAQAAILVPRH